MGEVGISSELSVGSEGKGVEWLREWELERKRLGCLLLDNEDEVE